MPTLHARLRGLRCGVAAAALLCWSCGGASTPSPPSGGTPSGTVTVRGTERLYWDQVGAVADLTFRAYVDGQAVPLAAATCDPAQAGAQGSPCVSPLPPLTVGVHTISLTALSRSSGLESAQSAPITVQKVSGLAVASSPSGVSDDAAAGAGARAIPATVTTRDGLVFDVTVLARGLDAPSQLALAPDGRLFVAERTGRVRVIDPEPAEGPVALDPDRLLDPPLAAPPGLALHPGFARNRLAYLATVSLDGRGQARLHVIRLREAGGTLGEPAVLFEQDLPAVPPGGPRLAFGPDRHLYVFLARSGEEAPDDGSARGGVILRLTEEGRAPDGAAEFASGEERPVALAWHPDSRAPWGVLASLDGRALLRQIGPGAGVGGLGSRRDATPVEVGRALTPGGLAFTGGSGAPHPAAFVALPDNESLLRLTPGVASPPEALLHHTLGRIGDIVAERGALWLATRNREEGGTADPADDLVIRLTPRER